MDAEAIIFQNEIPKPIDGSTVKAAIDSLAPNLTPLEIVPTLLNLLNMKDPWIRTHVIRVHSLTSEFVTYLRGKWLLLDADIETIETAAILHDIGKVGVLDEVLQKKSSLSMVERDHLEQHSEIGYRLLKDCPGMLEVGMAVRHHHERWDGGGYPLGLKETEIPLASRLIAIVDAYDAIISERPYKSARPEHEAIKEIDQEAGRQFCPTLAAQFVQFLYARNT